MYDVIVIGGGPGGVAAGVYAARKKMKTLLLTETFGGQSAVSATIENWIGEVSIPGFEYAQKLEKHLKAQEDIEIKVPEKASEIKKVNGGFEVLSDKGETYQTKTIIYTAGAQHRHLNVPGEEKFTGKGVVYCSTCDAPFFKEKTVAVVGTGNSGLEACQDLFSYASKIYLVSNNEKIAGDPITAQEVLSHEKVEVIYNASTKEIEGEAMVTGIMYEDIQTQEKKRVDLDGIFVEIGMVPNTELVQELVELNDWGEIKVDHRTAQTSQEGIFAAGDCVDVKFKQNNIAAGLGCVAALSAHEYVKKT